MIWIHSSCWFYIIRYTPHLCPTEMFHIILLISHPRVFFTILLASVWIDFLPVVFFVICFLCFLLLTLSSSCIAIGVCHFSIMSWLSIGSGNFNLSLFPEIASTFRSPFQSQLLLLGFYLRGQITDNIAVQTEVWLSDFCFCFFPSVCNLILQRLN